MGVRPSFVDVCGRHLLGRHRQLHSLQRRLRRRLYAQDAETSKWYGRMPELMMHHDLVVDEMTRRNYGHRSPIPFAPGDAVQLILPGAMPRFVVEARACGCLLGARRPVQLLGLRRRAVRVAA